MAENNQNQNPYEPAKNPFEPNMNPNANPSNPYGQEFAEEQNPMANMPNATQNPASETSEGMEQKSVERGHEEKKRGANQYTSGRNDDRGRKE